MDLVNTEEYARKIAAHHQWLCWVFGLTTILISITSLAFPSPWRIALLGLTAVIPMYLHAFLGNPIDLRILRQLARDPQASDSLIAEEQVKCIEKEFHGWRAVCKVWILLIGLFLYLIVLFSYTGYLDFIFWFAR